MQLGRMIARIHIQAEGADAIFPRQVVHVLHPEREAVGDEGRVEASLANVDLGELGGADLAGGMSADEEEEAVGHVLQGLFCGMGVSWLCRDGLV